MIPRAECPQAIHDTHAGNAPSLAAAVGRRVAMQQQPRVNTIINAGTGAGIILSVPVLLFLPGGWRAAFLLFGGVALVCLAPIAGYLPAGGVAPQMKNKRPLSGGWRARWCAWW